MNKEMTRIRVSGLLDDAFWKDQQFQEEGKIWEECKWMETVNVILGMLSLDCLWNMLVVICVTGSVQRKYQIRERDE